MQGDKGVREVKILAVFSLCVVLNLKQPCSDFVWLFHENGLEQNTFRWVILLNFGLHLKKIIDAFLDCAKILTVIFSSSEKLCEVFQTFHDRKFYGVLHFVISFG